MRLVRAGRGLVALEIFTQRDGSSTGVIGRLVLTSAQLNLVADVIDEIATDIEAEDLLTRPTTAARAPDGG